MPAATVQSRIINSKAVSAVQVVPAEIRRHIPRDGRSRCFGHSKVVFRGLPVFVHVYDVRKPDLSSNRASYGVRDYAPDERAFQALPLQNPQFYSIQRTAVDLYIRHGRHRRTWQRINSVAFNYVRFINPDFPAANVETVKVDEKWLDPGRKVRPILQVDLQNPNGAEGAVGTKMLIVFPGGLRGRAVAEGFGYGADNASERNSWGSSFDGVDKKGWLTIRSHHDTSTSSLETILGWNGHYFLPSRGHSQSRVP